jgi:HD-GYP domain-containing protein (c-di-GMP phosphodiesterase class II)
MISNATTHGESAMPDAPEIDRLAKRQATVDPDLALHGRVVGRYAAMTGQGLGLASEQTEELRLAGELHDIGKLAVPRSILEKPGPLDTLEWAQIRTHPVIGARLLRHLGLCGIADWVFDHHERPDGRGYPRGIRTISTEASVLAVADAYHAMTTDRPFRAAMSHPEAMDELRAGAGSQFDSSVVDAFLGAIDSVGAEPPHLCFL